MKRALLVVALLLSVACTFAVQGDENQIGGAGGGPVVTVEPFPSPLDSEAEGAFIEEDDDATDEHEDAEDHDDDQEADDSQEHHDEDTEIVAEKQSEDQQAAATATTDEAADKPAEEAESHTENADQPAEQKTEATSPMTDAEGNDLQPEPADDMAANGVTRAELADVDELNDEEQEHAVIPEAEAPTLLNADGEEATPSFLMMDEEMREPPMPKHSFMDSTDNNAFNMPGLDPSQPTDESALIDLSVPRNAEEAEENDAYRYLSPDEKQVIEEELHDAHFNIIPKLLHERSLMQAQLDAQF